MEETRNSLFTSASLLPPVSAEACEEYRCKALLMICRLNQVMEAREDLDDLIGPGNLELMRENHANHVHYFSTLLEVFEPGNLIDTVTWVVRTYRSRGFSLGYWPVMLDAAKRIAHEELSSCNSIRIVPYYEWIESHFAELAHVAEARDDGAQHERG